MVKDCKLKDFHLLFKHCGHKTLFTDRFQIMSNYQHHCKSCDVLRHKNDLMMPSDHQTSERSVNSLRYNYSLSFLFSVWSMNNLVVSLKRSEVLAWTIIMLLYYVSSTVFVRLSTRMKWYYLFVTHYIVKDGMRFW